MGEDGGLVGGLIMVGAIISLLSWVSISYSESDSVGFLSVIPWWVYLLLFVVVLEISFFGLIDGKHRKARESWFSYTATYKGGAFLITLLIGVIAFAAIAPMYWLVKLVGLLFKIPLTDWLAFLKVVGIMLLIALGIFLYLLMNTALAKRYNKGKKLPKRKAKRGRR